MACAISLLIAVPSNKHGFPFGLAATDSFKIFETYLKLEDWLGYLTGCEHTFWTEFEEFHEGPSCIFFFNFFYRNSKMISLPDKVEFQLIRTIPLSG